MFFSLLTWSHISGECVCRSSICRCKCMNHITGLDSNATSVILEGSCSLFMKFMPNNSTFAVEELYFNKTLLYGLGRKFILNFPNLKKLTFRYPRRFTEIIPVAIINLLLEQVFYNLHLTKISKLEIFGVNLSSSLNLLLMALNDTNITELSLVDCQLTTFNCSNFVSSLKHLQYLDLSHNSQAKWQLRI